MFIISFSLRTMNRRIHMPCIHDGIPSFHYKLTIFDLATKVAGVSSIGEEGDVS